MQGRGKYRGRLIKCMTRQLHFPACLGSGQPYCSPWRCTLFSFQISRNMEECLACASHAAQHQHPFPYLKILQHFCGLMVFMFRAGSVTQDTSFETRTTYCYNTQCVSQCCGGLVFSLYDRIQIAHCPPFPLKQRWHTEIILSAQRHVLFNDKPVYLQCVHLPHCILCATQIHTKLGNVLVVSISQYFWQRLDTKKRNLPALFSSSKH